MWFYKIYFKSICLRYWCRQCKHKGQNPLYRKKQVAEEQWYHSSVKSWKKIDVPYLIDNIINFEQGKGRYIWKKMHSFPSSLPFFLPVFLPSLFPNFLSNDLASFLPLFLALHSLTLSLSVSLLNSLKKSSQTPQSGHLYDTMGKGTELTSTWPWASTQFDDNFLFGITVVTGLPITYSSLVRTCCSTPFQLKGWNVLHIQRRGMIDSIISSSLSYFSAAIYYYSLSIHYVPDTGF